MSSVGGKLRTLLHLEHPYRRLYLEAFFQLGWSRILITFKFSRVAPSLGERWKETDAEVAHDQVRNIRDISQAIQLMSKYTPWESKCLVRAISGMKMLQRRGIESTLYLGTAKDENGALIAHAWLRSGPYYVSGAEVMEKFVTVDKYANTIKA
ncbi:lasso peptide biosynthesis B2 protein [Paenibacillus sp. sgz500958]|uniref:lasso peptide biosynthesis B2 protein n=1 Tax=Paenibacillus sp. sgz500958 TaxID=3242475 RepID=UPI0036D2C27F